MRWLALISLCFATPVLAIDLSLPGSQIAASTSTEAGSTRLPDAPWTNETPLAATEGAIRKTVLELPTTTATSLQLIAPLRQQLSAEGYTQTFACADAECGGFDFRFQMDMIGEPYMHVDLGNYRYVLMQKTGGEPHSVAIVASPGRDAGFVHVTEVSNASFPEATTETATAPGAVTLQTDDLTGRLVSNGHVVLADLVFATGSVDLGPGPFSSLEKLAIWLADNPSARVVLVGHTDSVGSLDANTSLSQRRAQAVADRLVNALGTNTAQLQSAGAGYLSPVASNLTAEGRTLNRRVEVVLLSRE